MLILRHTLINSSFIRVPYILQNQLVATEYYMHTVKYNILLYKHQ